MTRTAKTIRGLATTLGANPGSIANALKRGMFANAERTESGKRVWNVAKCKAIWAETADYRFVQSRGRTAGKSLPRLGSGGDSPADILIRAKAEREVLKLAAERREADVRSGLLIKRDDVRKSGERLAALLNDAIERFAPRFAPRLATLTDEREIHALLTREFDTWRAEIRREVNVL